MKNKLLLIIASIAIGVLAISCGSTSEPDDSQLIEDTAISSELTTEPKESTVTATSAAVSGTTVSVTTTTVASQETETSGTETTTAPSDDSEPEDPPDETTPSQPEPFSADDMIFEYGGYRANVMTNVSGLLGVLGSPKDVQESPSCYYDGNDKIYDYDSLEIYTYPQDGQDKIAEITLKTSDVSTSRGLKVGMTLDDAERLYGTNYQIDKGLHCYYVSSNVYMYFVLSGSKISEIGYVAEID